MRSHEIFDAAAYYREMSALDLVAELRSFHFLDMQPPVDLVAALEARGENFNAIMVDIERGK